MGKCILAGHPLVGGQIGYGTYTGDGAASRFIDLGITPKWVLVAYEGAMWSLNSNNQSGSGLAVSGNAAKISGTTVVSIAGNGFYVYYPSSYYAMSNCSGVKYNYIYGT